MTETLIEIPHATFDATLDHRRSVRGWWTHSIGEIRVNCPRCGNLEIWRRPLDLIPADGIISVKCQDHYLGKGCGLEGMATLVDLGRSRDRLSFRPENNRPGPKDWNPKKP